MKPVVVEPWKPAKWTDETAGAIKALSRGEAAPHQQKIALDWIINHAAATYDLSYRPASARDSDFAEGKRFVGLQIVKLVNLDLRRIKQAKQEKVNARPESGPGQ